MIESILNVGKEYCKNAAISAACMVADVRIFKNFIDITSIAALMLLLNNDGNNRNSVKSIGLHSMISNSIVIQLLENVQNDHANIFDKK